MRNVWSPVVNTGTSFADDRNKMLKREAREDEKQWRRKTKISSLNEAREKALLYARMFSRNLREAVSCPVSKELVASTFRGGVVIKSF
jgi:hypothetical protein